MTELLAKIQYLWIEHGDTAAAVIFVVAIAALLIAALRKGETNE